MHWHALQYCDTFVNKNKDYCYLSKFSSKAFFKVVIFPIQNYESQLIFTRIIIIWAHAMTSFWLATFSTLIGSPFRSTCCRCGGLSSLHH